MRGWTQHEPSGPIRGPSTWRCADTETPQPGLSPAPPVRRPARWRLLLIREIRNIDLLAIGPVCPVSSSPLLPPPLSGRRGSRGEAAGSSRPVPRARHPPNRGRVVAAPLLRPTQGPTPHGSASSVLIGWPVRLRPDPRSRSRAARGVAQRVRANPPVHRRQWPDRALDSQPRPRPPRAPAGHHPQATAVGLPRGDGEGRLRRVRASWGAARPGDVRQPQPIHRAEPRRPGPTRPLARPWRRPSSAWRHCVRLHSADGSVLCRARTGSGAVHDWLSTPIARPRARGDGGRSDQGPSRRAAAHTTVTEVPIGTWLVAQIQSIAALLTRAHPWDAG